MGRWLFYISGQAVRLRVALAPLMRLQFGEMYPNGHSYTICP